MDIINGDEIIELKRDVIDCNAVGQLLRYLVSSNRVKGKLCAPDIISDAALMINTIKVSGYNIRYIKVSISNDYEYSKPKDKCSIQKS